MTLEYFVLKDNTRQERMAEAVPRAGTAQIKRTAGGAMRSTTALPTADAALQTPADYRLETHMVRPNDVANIEASEARDEMTAAQGFAMPVVPIRAMTAAGTERSPVYDEILADEARAGGDSENWAFDPLGAHEDTRYTGQSARVAVIDSGLNAAHQAFRGVDVIAQDFTGSGDPSDHDGHGTHCAGTIVGRAVNGRRIGVAPGVRTLICARVFAEGVVTNTRMIRSALSWCVHEQNANVVSMSLGFDPIGFARILQEQYGLPQEAAFARCLLDFQNNLKLFDTFGADIAQQEETGTSPGTVIVVASGNHSRRVGDANKIYTVPAGPPASALSAISVGALRRIDAGTSLAAYSNSHNDFVAPGSGILSAAHDSDDGFTIMSGTSMATPHVAGIAALYWDFVNTTPGPKKARNVIARMQTAASYDGILTNDHVTDCGDGQPRAPQSI